MNDREHDVHCLVVTGYGVNCEKEMALAARQAGAQTAVIQLQRLLREPNLLESTDLLLFPGGFSFGDELGAAKVYANKFAFTSHGGTSLKKRLQEFVTKGGAVFGVCNGFQLLIKLGLLPSSSDGTQQASLVHNSSGRFENRWCEHLVNDSSCIFTRGLTSLYLPARHGEGRFVTDVDTESKLFVSRQVVLQYAVAGEPTERYPHNPNGSRRGIAGICDETGRVFGMMAHPEAFVHPYQHPHWTRQTDRPDVADGLKIFSNGIQYLREQKAVVRH